MIQELPKLVKRQKELTLVILVKLEPAHGVMSVLCTLNSLFADDDFVPSSSNSRDKKTKKKENSPQQKVKPKKTREKSVKPSAADKTPKVQDSSKRKIKEQVDIISHHSKKRKVADQELHEDQDFLAVLEDHDRDAKAKSKEKSRDHSKKATGSRNHRTKVQDALERNKTRRSTPQKSVSTPRKSNQNDDIRSSKAVTATTKLPEIPMSDVLWVDKYKPTNLKSIIGQQGEKSNMNKLKKWLTNWTRHHSGGKKPPPRPPPFAHNDDGSWAKAALLSGKNETRHISQIFFKNTIFNQVLLVLGKQQLRI